MPTISSILTDRRIEAQELTREFYPATAGIFEDQLRCDDLANPPWRMGQIASSSLQLFRTEAARVGIGPEASAPARGPGTPWDELVSLQSGAEEAAPDEIVEASRAKPHFLRWGYIDQKKVWPNRSSDDVFHFRGGALVQGSLSCVEEVVYNAGGYDRFIPRVTKSEWIGRAPEMGVRNKSGIASGLVSGRYGLGDRISAVQMTETVEQAGTQVRVGFDTYDRRRRRDLNHDLPTRSTRNRVLADTAGEWILRRPQNPAAGTEQVVVSYKTTVDINTWIFDSIVSTAIPSDTREVFEDILAEIRKRCAPKR